MSYLKPFQSVFRAIFFRTPLLCSTLVIIFSWNFLPVCLLHEVELLESRGSLNCLIYLSIVALNVRLGI